MNRLAADETHESPGQPLLSLAGITVSFGGITALSNVSFDVREGVVFGVIGPNGAGKTTLFNAVCGFIRPDEGTLQWRGSTLERHRPHDLQGLGISRTLQGLGLFDNMTVRENVTSGLDAANRAGFFASMLALPRATRNERILVEKADEILEDLGLVDVADKSPSLLPYALRKRVALARALASEPRLLLLDEPASGLSQQEMDELASIIGRLRSRCSVMLVEHHMDLVMAITDEIAVLDFGRLIAVGSPAEIRENPAVTAAYLGDAVESSDANGAIDA